MEAIHQEEWEASCNGLVALRDELTAFDIPSLGAVCGGLQLYLPNANRLVRFQALANTIASIGETSSKPKKPSARWLQKLLTKAPLGDGLIRRMEDPFSGTYVEEIGYHGGGYLGIGGAIEHDKYSLQLLLDAIFHASKFPNLELCARVDKVVRAVLTLSDLMCRRAGLRRGTGPSDANDILPKAQILDRLTSAVRFDIRRLGRQFSARGSDIQYLADLMLEPGDIPVSSYQFHDAPIFFRPLLLVGSEMIVLAPPLLFHALRCHILQLFRNVGAIEWLNHRFHSVTQRDVQRALDRLGYQFEPNFSSAPEVTTTFSWMRAMSDPARLEYICVLTEDLRKLSPQKPFDNHFDEKVNDALFSKLLMLEEDATNRVRIHSAKLLIVVVLQNCSGVIALRSDIVPKPSTSILFVNAASLNSISLLPGTDETTLRKFAKVREDSFARRDYQILGFDEEFGTYLHYGESFYVSDDVPPGSSISLGVGFCNRLHERVAETVDPRLAPLPDGKSHGPVVLAHRDRSIPIYVHEPPWRGGAGIFVDCGKLEWWFLPHGTSPDHKYGIAIQFADAFAFWVWKCDVSLRRLFAKHHVDASPIVVQIECDASGDWRTYKSQEVAIPESVSLRVDHRNRVINVCLRDSVLRMLSRSDNAGERDLMLALYEQLFRMHRVPNAAEHASKIVERHIPLGRAKRMIVAPTLGGRSLAQRGLPDVRTISRAEVGLLSDQLSDFARGELKYAPGIVPNAQRCELLNQVVGWLYRTMEEKVAALSHVGLLETLISQNEALLSKRNERGANDPARLACFGTQIGEIIHKEVREETSANIASRFLIEYVAARPPSGAELLSMDRYDELLALANLIFSTGVESDLIHFQIADIPLRVLPSGRLAAGKSKYDYASDAYARVMEGGRRRHLEGKYELIWAPHQPIAAQPTDVAEWDRAAESEFGFTLSEILDCLSVCANIADKSSDGITILPRTEASAIISKEATISLDRVSDIVDFLTLSSRDNFLEPAAPFTRYDVVPWRFNRPLSYLRRPIVKRGDNLILPFGALRQSQEFIVDTCFNGRLKAKSSLMKAMISREQNRAATEFENEVRDRVARDCAHVRSKAQVKKIRYQGTTIASPGDIDVVCVNLKRRSLWCIECKDLELARTPVELSNEIALLIKGGTTTPSTVEKHTARIEWAKRNLSALLSVFQILDSAEWHVRGLIVTSSEIMSPYIENCRVPIMAVNAAVRLVQA